jgi:transcriptional regulator with XRE-family HTH domain
MSGRLDDPRMDSVRVGSAVRAVRLQQGLTQDEVGIASGTSRFVVARIEAGRIDGITFGRLRAVAKAAGVQLDLVVRWNGGDLGRLLNARHAAFHEAMARRLGTSAGWVFEPEVSFSIEGERGVIDVLAWHAATRSLLVIELKTEIVDVNDLMTTVDRRRRLASRIAAGRGWAARTVSVWVAVAESRTNRRRLARHELVLRSKLPDDGHRVRTMLGAPSGAIAALSFMTTEQLAHGGAPVAGRSRVRHARATLAGFADFGQPSIRRS